MQLISYPDYPTKHDGTVFVAGGAPCLHDDLAAARDLRPDPSIPIIGVNQVFRVLPTMAIVSAHPELLPDRNTIVHEYPSDQRVPKQPHQFADFVWRGPHLTGGTSSLAAVMVAKAIGFDEVIACGIPLEQTGYVEGYREVPDGEFSGKKQMTATLQQRRKSWADCCTAGHMRGIYSMSGATRNILGAPPALRKEAV